MQLTKRIEEIGDPSTVPSLIAALRLQDIDSNIRIALVKIGKAAVPSLISALQDPCNIVVAEVLGEIGDARAIPPLENLLSQTEKYEEYTLDTPYWRFDSYDENGRASYYSDGNYVYTETRVTRDYEIISNALEKLNRVQDFWSYFWSALLGACIALLLWLMESLY